MATSVSTIDTGALLMHTHCRLREEFAAPSTADEVSPALSVLANAQCLTLACPPCLSLNLAMACSSFVTTLNNSGDIVPLLSFANGNKLMAQVFIV